MANGGWHIAATVPDSRRSDKERFLTAIMAAR